MLFSLFLLFAVVPFGTNSFVMRSYDSVNHLEYDSIDEFKRTFFNMPESRASMNMIVAYTTPECKDQVTDNAALYGSQRHAGAYSFISATIITEQTEFPLTTENCAEIHFYRFNSLFTEPVESTTDFELHALTNWVHSRMAVEGFLITNTFDFPIDVFWYDESKSPVKQDSLEPGKAATIGTHLGHIFVARKRVNKDAGWNEENPIVDWISVKEDGYYFGPFNHLETCEHFIPDPSLVFSEKEIDCEDMEQRFFEFCQQVWYTVRQGGNFFQPKIVRAVTSNGFEKRKLPAETYQWLKEWYEKEKALQESVESSSGPCMNQHVAPSGITHLTPELKDKLAEELRHIHEGWYGGDLTMTSIYGIRKYTNGSVLRMHVDTVSTHVVSSIINVDQSVRKDWPLLILDHYGNEHNVTMEPGDMVLYESAKLLHGRPEPMDGDHYDNIFIHYQPVSGWDYGWI